jgi:hypothetical protein
MGANPFGGTNTKKQRKTRNIGYIGDVTSPM